MQSLRDLERGKEEMKEAKALSKSKAFLHHLLIDMCYFYEGCRTTMYNGKTHQNISTVHRRRMQTLKNLDADII